MWLILTETHDPCARWLLEGLGRRANRPVLGVNADDLARARQWEHRVEVGRSFSRVRLESGREITSTEVTGMVNRLVRPPAQLLHKVHTADRTYSAQEWAALCISWLHSFHGPILNPVSPGGLSGPYRHPLEWLVLARRAGLATAQPRFQSTQTPQVYFSPPSHPEQEQSLWVVGSRVLATAGPSPDAVTTNAARQLASLAATPLLELRGRAGDSGWTLLAANPWPDLRAAGEALLDALADALAETPLTPILPVIP